MRGECECENEKEKQQQSGWAVGTVHASETRLEWSRRRMAPLLHVNGHQE